MTNLRPLLGGARALSASFPDQTSSLNRQTSFNVPGPRAASVGPMAPRRDDAAVFTRMPDNFSEMPGYFAAGIERRHAEASRFAAEHAVDNAGGERFSLSMSHDEFSSEYIYLIASLDPEVQSGAKQLSDKVAEVEQAVMRTASPETPEASRAASVEQYAAISASEAMSVYFASDGWNAQLYAEASATLKAYYAERVTLADGSTVTVQAQIEVSVSVQLAIQTAQQPTQQSDPLALDLDQDGHISLTDAPGGAVFDINSDGMADQSAFVTGSDVFLALDRNGNGSIDNGSELFGDQHGAANGFLELSKFDANNDGVIDAEDPVFQSLGGVRLNGKGELQFESLARLGVSAVSLCYADTDRAAQGGNRITQAGSYVASDGEKGEAVDVMLNYLSIDRVS